jgi:hypothetical protein
MGFRLRQENFPRFSQRLAERPRVLAGRQVRWGVGLVIPDLSVWKVPEILGPAKVFDGKINLFSVSATIWLAKVFGLCSRLNTVSAKSLLLGQIGVLREVLKEPPLLKSDWDFADNFFELFSDRIAFDRGETD